jgi:hypothetical protein
VRRPLRAHDDFHAFWADGNPDTQSEARPYFTDRNGRHLGRLPYQMDGKTATPQAAYPVQTR